MGRRRKDRPQNIIFIVADSLRYDALARSDAPTLPYLEQHATKFTQARSAGCWTLPATASMFTGLLPHEHGATTQSRAIDENVLTLPQRLQALDYETLQITGNPATTEVFGLDRGFERTQKIWNAVDQRHRVLDTALWILSRPRIRKKVFNQKKDFIAGRLAKDVDASRAWMQSNGPVQFRLTREAIARAKRQQKGAFIFVNLMECHFPYHIADTFELASDGVYEKIRELYSLYHFIHQTRLVSHTEPIAEDMLGVLRRRQMRAWDRFAHELDEFVRELHEDTNNLVVFCSDHGDAFGEQNWQYHFSNVTDGGNRTPLYVLEPGQRAPQSIHTPVSMRDLNGTLLELVGAPNREPQVNLLREPEASLSVLESFWYNKADQTLPEYRKNQFAFINGQHKYVCRGADEWFRVDWQQMLPEPDYEPLPRGYNGIEEADLEPATREQVRHQFNAFLEFASRVDPEFHRQQPATPNEWAPEPEADKPKNKLSAAS